MAVRWEEIELPLSGIDQFTDAPHVLANQLREAVNVRFWEPPKAGKRYGFERNCLSSDLDSFPITKATRLHALDKQTVMVGDSKLYVQSEKNFKMTSRGQLSEVLVERVPVMHDQSFDRKDADLAWNDNIMVVAWPAGQSEAGAVVINTETGAVIQAITWGATFFPTWVRVISIGNYICIFGDFNGGSATQLGVIRIDAFASGQYVTATNPTPTFIAIPNATSTTTLPDVAAISTTDYVVAYKDNVTGTFKVIRCDVATHTIQATHAGPAASCVCVGVEGVSDEKVYGAYEQAGSLKAVVLNATTLAVTSGPTTLEAVTATRVGIARITSNKRLFTWEAPVNGTIDPHLKYRSMTDTSATGTLFELFDLVPTSKPFIRDGRIYEWVAYDEAAQPTFYLAELTDDTINAQTARWVGTAARGIAKEAQANGYLSSVVATNTGSTTFESAITCNYRVRFASKNDKTVSVARAGINRLKMDFGSERRHDAAMWGKSLVLAGSRLSMFDGHDAHEHGFAWYPGRFAASTETFFGKLAWSPGDTYLYCFVYEWEDHLGQIHRSAPSEIKTHTAVSNTSGTSNGEISVAWQETLWTTHGGFGSIWNAATNVRIIPYRTIKGGTGNLYRDSILGYNPTNGTAVKIGHDFNDTDLELQDVLYITGDILDNAGPPACSLVCYHGERMWLGGTEEPEWLSFSQPFVEGEAPRFNEGLRVLIGKPVRAMASMDGELVVWTDQEIYLVVGNGPPATGGLDVGFTAVLISTETGCQEPRSVCLTSEGLGFLGGKGYALLDRAKQVQWIGLPAKLPFQVYNNITSAVVTPDARFLMVTATVGSTSAWHVYDLTLKQWTIDTAASALGKLIDGTVAWDADRDAWGYAVASTAGGLFWQKPDVFFDDTASGGAVIWEITTAWIQRASLGANGPLQGWQFIKEALIFGDFDNCDGFVVEVWYDYETAATTSYTFTKAELAAITALDRNQVLIDFEFMQCEAFRLRIYETFEGAEVNYNRGGPNVRSITLIAGFQKGPFRIEDAAVH